MTVATQEEQVSLARLPYYANGREEQLEHPAPWRCGDWLISTNGRLLVAIASPRVGDEPDTLPKMYREAPETILNTAVKHAVPATFSKLVEMAGAPQLPSPQPCELCEGDGRGDEVDAHDCEHCGRSTRPPCEDCHGSGIEDVWPNNRNRIILGKPFNVGLLAYGLALVEPVERVAIGLFGPKADALMVIADGWRIAQAGLAPWTVREAPEWVTE